MSRATRCEPTKPAPPVTRMRGRGSVWRNGTQAADDAGVAEVACRRWPFVVPATYSVAQPSIALSPGRALVLSLYQCSLDGLGTFLWPLPYM
eukprot:3634731-Prymnesium_polylepis.3